MKPGGLKVSSPSVSLSVSLSVPLSVPLSVSLSVKSTQCPSTRFSELISVVLWDIDFKFGIWICLDMIQIKFDYGCVWPTFNWVIALFKNLVFRTFLSLPWRYWLEILYMNLSWHNTDQVRVLSHFTFFDLRYSHFLNCSFPDFSLSFSRHWLEISYMNLSWRNTGQVQLLSCLTYF